MKILIQPYDLEQIQKCAQSILAHSTDKTVTLNARVIATLSRIVLDENNLEEDGFTQLESISQENL